MHPPRSIARMIQGREPGGRMRLLRFIQSAKDGPGGPGAERKTAGRFFLGQPPSGRPGAGPRRGAGARRAWMAPILDGRDGVHGGRHG